jgi:hypothetical protein
LAKTSPDEVPAAPDAVHEAPAPVPAAPAPNGPNARGQGIHTGGGGVTFGAPNPEMQLAMIQQLLKVADDDWNKLSPKLEKVLTAKKNMNTGAG